MLKSIGLAAANATVSPGVLDSWVAEIEKHVAENGKFSKSQAGIVRALWENWEQGTPSVSEDYLLDSVGSESYGVAVLTAVPDGY